MDFGSDAEMQKKWNAFYRKINTRTDDFDTVLRMIKEFLAEPFATAIINGTFTNSWSANDNRWIYGGKNNG